MFEVEFYEDRQGKQSVRDNTFILLHHFIKKTHKTPPGEIEQATRNLKDFLERND